MSIIYKDANGNVWTHGTVEDAIKASNSLINCNDCRDCEDCKDSSGCFFSSELVECTKCRMCTACFNCYGLTNREGAGNEN